MEALAEYWHQIFFFIGAIIMDVRLESEGKSNRRDLNHIKE